jgi:peptidoglycan/xylan/chitin deacetylase (PgdA/CDA1 family)
MSRRLILSFALGAALFFLALVAFHPFLALGVLFLSHLLILFPTLVANCQWWGPVVTHFETTKREVWLTIDDGPDPIHTPRMLAILARFEARATFFVIGSRAAKFPRELEAIRAAGDRSLQYRHTIFSRPRRDEKFFRASGVATARSAVGGMDGARARHSEQGRGRGRGPNHAQSEAGRDSPSPRGTPDRDEAGISSGLSGADARRPDES